MEGLRLLCDSCFIDHAGEVLGMYVTNLQCVKSYGGAMGCFRDTRGCLLSAWRKSSNVAEFGVNGRRILDWADSEVSLFVILYKLSAVHPTHSQLSTKCCAALS